MSDEIPGNNPVRPKLAWGLREAVPTTAPAAWGARAIFKNGQIDLLWDRQGGIGEAGYVTRLVHKVNDALSKVREEAARLHEKGELAGRYAKQYTLYEDETLLIVGDTLASQGYLYLAGWLKA